MKEQSKSIALLAEFEGQKLQGKTIAMLSYRIDGLIRLAVSEERHRCHDATKQGFVMAIGEILEMKSAETSRLADKDVAPADVTDVLTDGASAAKRAREAAMKVLGDARVSVEARNEPTTI